MIVGIKCHFDAAHFLPNYPGKCKEMHGHTWTVEVEVEGEADFLSGMVIDFKDFKYNIEKVIESLDHSLLNNKVNPPTCELIASYIKNAILNTGLKVNKVKVQEGDGGWAII